MNGRQRRRRRRAARRYRVEWERRVSGLRRYVRRAREALSAARAGSCSLSPAQVAGLASVLGTKLRAVLHFVRSPDHLLDRIVRPPRAGRRPLGRDRRGLSKSVRDSGALRRSLESLPEVRRWLLSRGVLES